MIKRLLIIIATLLLTIKLFPQSPEKISYQAVIRDADGNLLANTTVGMQIGILQGSPGGTTVYTETQELTTNINGLISLQIGSGDIVNGDISIIDWSTGPYFIKTETDLNGGTSYTITGVNQLLSIPYALHAKTAENVTGTTETDPVFTNSEAANITTLDITNLGNLSGVNTGDQDLSNYSTIVALSDSCAQVRSEIPDVGSFIDDEVDLVYLFSAAISISANDITNLSNLSGVNTGDQDLSGLATETSLGDSIMQLRNTIPSITTYSIGDFAQGGVVFWVDETGQHGLACAIDDQDGGSGIQWYNGSYTNTEALGDGLYAGEMNTMLVNANQGAATNYAAELCLKYTVSQNSIIYADWYLPSMYELELMRINKSTIDAIATANGGDAFTIYSYWSSCEYDANNARIENINNGYQGNANKNIALRVRAVRAF